MKGRAVLGVFCGGLALAACVLKADGFTGGASAPDSGSELDTGTVTPALEAGPPESEAGTTDGGRETDAGSDAASAATTNVLVNGDFENGCSSWIASDTNALTLAASADAHTGQKSCRVCMNTNDTQYVFQAVTVHVPLGERLFGQIFVRGAQANPPGSPIQLLLNYDPVTNGDDDDDSPASSLQPNPTTWLRMSMVQEIYDADAKQITLVLTIAGNQNKCFLIDDAALGVMPDE